MKRFKKYTFIHHPIEKKLRLRPDWDPRGLTPKQTIVFGVMAIGLGLISKLLQRK